MRLHLLSDCITLDVVDENVTESFDSNCTECIRYHNPVPNTPVLQLYILRVQGNVLFDNGINGLSRMCSKLSHKATCFCMSVRMRSAGSWVLTTLTSSASLCGTLISTATTNTATTDRCWILTVETVRKCLFSVSCPPKTLWWRCWTITKYKWIQ